MKDEKRWPVRQRILPSFPFIRSLSFFVLHPSSLDVPMISFPPPILFRPKRRPPKSTVVAPVPPPSPPALSLVAVAYSPGSWVELQFDRAIDISAMLPGVIVVSDSNLSNSYVGNGATLIDPATVHVDLIYISGGASTPDVELIAAGSNGIVAVDDTAAWAGTSGVVIPFP
jgi:hypothetical protein